MLMLNGVCVVTVSGGSSVGSGVGGITTTPLGLVEFDVLRFRNSFLQVTFRLLSTLL